MKSSSKQEIANVINKSDVLQVQLEIVKRSASASAKKSTLDQITKAVTSAINDQRDVIFVLIKVR